MSTVYDELDETLIGFIRRQKLFFVATAPLSAEGSVNVSPKGYDSLAIIDSKTVAYVDLGGSGIETHAHLRENSRVTLMFCAFEGPANIVRVYGRGETCSFDEPGFAQKMKLFPAFERARGHHHSNPPGGRQLRLGRPLFRLQGRARPTPALGRRKTRSGMGGAPIRNQRGLHRWPARPRAVPE